MRRLGSAAALACVAAFAGLFALAAREYPGGTDWDRTARGHDPWRNFACDLTRSVALNGEPNPNGSLLAQAAMIVLSLGLFPLWALVPHLVPARPRLGVAVRVLGYVGAAAAIAVVLMPSDRFGRWHALAILLAGPPGIAALLLSVLGLAREEARPPVTAAVGAAMLLAAAAAFILYFAYLGRTGPVVAAVLENLSLLLLLVFMVFVAVRAARLR